MRTQVQKLTLMDRNTTPTHPHTHNEYANTCTHALCSGVYCSIAYVHTISYKIYMQTMDIYHSIIFVQCNTHAHMYMHNVHAHTMYTPILLAIVSGVITAPFTEETPSLRRDKDDNITTPHPYRHSSPLRCGPH